MTGKSRTKYNCQQIFQKDCAQSVTNETRRSSYIRVSSVMHGYTSQYLNHTNLWDGKTNNVRLVITNGWRFNRLSTFFSVISLKERNNFTVFIAEMEPRLKGIILESSLGWISMLPTTEVSEREGAKWREEVAKADPRIHQLSRWFENLKLCVREVNSLLFTAQLIKERCR